MKIIDTAVREVTGVSKYIAVLRDITARNGGGTITLTRPLSSVQVEISAEEWHLVLDAAERGDAGN